MRPAAHLVLGADPTRGIKSLRQLPEASLGGLENFKI
jgi:hypothetical protein